MNQTLPNTTIEAAHGEVTIVTVCSGQGSPAWTSMCRVMLQNCKLYARQHGYGLMAWDFNLAQPRSVLWSKIPALSYALQQASTRFVWWQDGDSLFVDMQKPLTSMLPAGNATLTISGDAYCYLNSGHFMIRRGSWSAQFLQRVWDIDPWPQPSAWPEQAAMVYFLSGSPQRCRSNAVHCCNHGKRHPNLDEHVDYREYGVLHTYAVHYDTHRSFVVHFARNTRGALQQTREALMRAYAENASAQLSHAHAPRAKRVATN